MFFSCPEEALQFKRGTEREIFRPPSQRIADVLAEWQTQKLHAAESKPQSVNHQFGRLSAFFAPAADEDIAALTPRGAEAVYQQATERISPKTGEVLSAASHRRDR